MSFFYKLKTSLYQEKDNSLNSNTPFIAVFWNQPQYLRGLPVSATWPNLEEGDWMRVKNKKSDGGSCPRTCGLSINLRRVCGIRAEASLEKPKGNTRVIGHTRRTCRWACCKAWTGGRALGASGTGFKEASPLGTDPALAGSWEGSLLKSCDRDIASLTQGLAHWVPQFNAQKTREVYKLPGPARRSCPSLWMSQL